MKWYEPLLGVAAGIILFAAMLFATGTLFYIVGTFMQWFLRGTS